MENNVNKLDLTRPSKELLTEAYTLARKVWDIAPWESLVEIQVLAIQFADGQKGFVSVMGRDGVHRSICLYPSFAAFMHILAINDDDQLTAVEAFCSTNMLQLFFAPANLMKDGEMRDIRNSGIKFKRGFNPSLVSYLSGFEFDRMGGRELARFVAFLKAFLDFYEQHGPDAISHHDRPNKLLTTWTESESGKWEVGENDYSAMSIIEATLDESLIESVAALPVSDRVKTLEMAAFPVPMGRTPGGRVKMARYVLVMDQETGLPLGVTVINSPDDRELDWTPIVEFALKSFVDFGYRPQRLAAFGRGLRGILKILCKTRFKGTEFISEDSCQAAKRAFKIVYSGMEW